jgi:hypothetical protein
MTRPRIRAGGYAETSKWLLPGRRVEAGADPLAGHVLDQIAVGRGELVEARSA